MLFEEFQDGHHGHHLGYRNGMILAILTLYVMPMPPIKFWLNLTYGFGGDVVQKIVAAVLDIRTNDFSNSESLCDCDASHQVLALSDLPFGRRCCLKNLKMAILDTVREPF